MVFYHNQNRFQRSFSDTKAFNAIRELVSREKRRFVDEGYNLDLSYIGPRQVAMGFPSKAFEGVYRNPLDAVRRFLEQRHGGHYKVYNLCAERLYPHTYFNAPVEEIPFDDHQAPSIEQMIEFCQSASQWLARDADNIVVVHCKAGKGRTGVMIGALLLHTLHFDNAHEALRFYAWARTKDMKGVTIPSQRRYVQYYSDLIFRMNGVYTPRPLRLMQISVGCFHQNSTTHCSPTRRSRVAFRIVISRGHGCKRTELFRSELQHANFDEPWSLQFNHPLTLLGDIHVEFKTRNSCVSSTKETVLFAFWFNTTFEEARNGLQLLKSDLDKAHKDKKSLFLDDFYCQCEFADNN